MGKEFSQLRSGAAMARFGGQRVKRLASKSAGSPCYLLVLDAENGKYHRCNEPSLAFCHWSTACVHRSTANGPTAATVSTNSCCTAVVDTARPASRPHRDML